MPITNHIQTRMNQRGIRRALVELALEHGEPTGDRYVLDRKACERRLAELAEERRALEEARRKGGVTVVEENGALISTWRTTSASKPRNVK